MTDKQIQEQLQAYLKEASFESVIKDVLLPTTNALKNGLLDCIEDHGTLEADGDSVESIQHREYVIAQHSMQVGQLNDLEYIMSSLLDKGHKHTE